MAKFIIPFSPLPIKVLLKLSAPLLSFGSKLSRAFPYLGLELEQAGIELDVKRYSTIMFLLSIFYFFFFLIVSTLLFAKLVRGNSFFLALTVSAILAFLVFIQISMYPKILVKQKVRNLERNLVFGLRTMLVQIKSGVGLFDAMKMIANGNYGILSVEFKKAVDKIETGTLQDEALQSLATNNPSAYFRKSISQIINGMKAGADVGSVLDESVSSILREQKIAIQRFGAQLRLLSLVYLMIGVIVPALGLTFLIVLGSFPRIQITETIFWILLIATCIMEFMYVGLIKSRRPNLLS